MPDVLVGLKCLPDDRKVALVRPLLIIFCTVCHLYRIFITLKKKQFMLRADSDWKNGRRSFDVSTKNPLVIEIAKN